jgi:hypothetical protein
VESITVVNESYPKHSRGMYLGLNRYAYLVRDIVSICILWSRIYADVTEVNHLI